MSLLWEITGYVFTVVGGLLLLAAICLWVVWGFKLIKEL